MFSITWIDGDKVQSLSHPTERVIMQLWFSMLASGNRCRMWGKDRKLIA